MKIEDCVQIAQFPERDAFVVVVGRRQSLNYHTFNIKNNSQVELSGRPLDEVDKDPPPVCALHFDFNPRNVMAKAEAEAEGNMLRCRPAALQAENMVITSGCGRSG